MTINLYVLVGYDFRQCLGSRNGIMFMLELLDITAWLP